MYIEFVAKKKIVFSQHFLATVELVIISNKKRVGIIFLAGESFLFYFHYDTFWLRKRCEKEFIYFYFKLKVPREQKLLVQNAVIV